MRARACLLIAATSVAACGGSAQKEQSQPRPAPRAQRPAAPIPAYLRDGVWDDERILPEGWVQYSRTPSAAKREYGAGWWLDLKRPGVFYALGTKGQVMAVAPRYDLTFVLLSTDGHASLPLSGAIMDAFARGR